MWPDLHFHPQYPSYTSKSINHHHSSEPKRAFLNNMVDTGGEYNASPYANRKLATHHSLQTQSVNQV